MRLIPQANPELTPSQPRDPQAKPELGVAQECSGWTPSKPQANPEQPQANPSKPQATPSLGCLGLTQGSTPSNPPGFISPQITGCEAASL